MTLTHLDCFAGCGGLAAGFAGLFRTVAAIERDRYSAASYATNHPAVPVIQADIRDVSAWDIVRHLPRDGFARRPVECVTSGFPCEVWSSARNKPAAADDPRRTLYREAIRLAQVVQARTVLFENVPRITSRETFPGSGRLVVDAIKSELRQAGYGNQMEVVLNAARFGAATHRKRWFLLAAMDPHLDLRAPTPTHARPVTVREALAGLPLDPCDTPDARDGIPSWHVAAGVGPAMVARYSLIRPGRRAADLHESLPPAVVEAFQRTRVLPEKPFNQRGYRLRWDGPAPTMTTHVAEEWVHPVRHRPLTIRECARIQGFRDEYEFRGPLSRPHNSDGQDLYAQIGDSVCPPVARAWAEVLKEILP